MNVLGNGLAAANVDEDALAVRETELSIMRRIGDSEGVLIAQNNIASMYQELGRHEEALLLRQEVYSKRLRFNGKENISTLRAAYNYANDLLSLQRFVESRSLLRETLPVAQRFLGGSYDLTLALRCIYARTLYENPAATLDDVREAVTTLEDDARVTRRVFGGAHPATSSVEIALRESRAALRARDPAPPGSA
jgi:tetratricopeptide (TPR) repeat protein